MFFVLCCGPFGAVCPSFERVGQTSSKYSLFDNNADKVVSELRVEGFRALGFKGSSVEGLNLWSSGLGTAAASSNASYAQRYIYIIIYIYKYTAKHMEYPPQGLAQIPDDRVRATDSFQPSSALPSPHAGCISQIPGPPPKSLRIGAWLDKGTKPTHLRLLLILRNFGFLQSLAKSNFKGKRLLLENPELPLIPIISTRQT